MKKKLPIRKFVILFCLVLSFFKGSFAQQNSVTAGGNAYGAGGTVSFSIGQLDFEAANGPGGSITEGLQQPFEILVISGIEETGINLILSVYPNPATDFVVLSVPNSSIENMSYVLYDIESKLIEKQKLNSSQTSIDMKDLANGIYFINVIKKSIEVKVFKVIKNN